MLNCTFPLQALTEVVNYCAINKCSQSGLDCFLYWGYSNSFDDNKAVYIVASVCWSS